jgi:hypothetical protein
MQRLHAGDGILRRPVGREEVDQPRFEWEQHSEVVSILRHAGGMRPLTSTSGASHNRKSACP